MKFSEFDLHPLIQANLVKINFSECTPIQEQAIGPLLQGRDVAGLAQTGTGKTAAFLLPLIDRVLRGMENKDSEQQPETPAAAPFPSSEAGAQPAATVTAASEPESKPAARRFFTDWKKRQFILILVPTRELAEQVYTNAVKFLEGTSLSAVSIYGGTSYETQKRALNDGVEFVIATPGRLIDLFKEHLVDLRQVRAVVFDEADRMFDMGFKDDMKFILKRLPRERQFLVFSATMNFDVLNTAYEFGADPVEINISKDKPKADNVRDELFHIGQTDKPAHLLSLIKKYNPRQVIVFSNFKHNVERIAVFLNRNELPAMGISSLLTQAQRMRVMEQFKAVNDRNILIATDLAARGLDILGVDMVINYDLPDDPENYVHRIGRTGRAGQTGVAFSMVSDRDVDALSRVEQYLGHKVPTGWLESNELLKDFKPFPSDFEIDPDKRPPRRGASGGGDRGGRGDGPRRHSGPPRGGSGGGGGRDRDRDRDQRDPRGDRRPSQGPRPQQGQGGGGRDGGGHRDRHLGRHRRHEGGGAPGAAADAQGQSGSDQTQQQPHSRPRPQGQQPQRSANGGSGSPQQNQQRKDFRGRPSGGGSGQGGPRGRHGQQNSRRPGDHRSGSGGQNRPGRPGHPAAAGSKGIGQKVSGFFKRLFGG